MTYEHAFYHTLKLQLGPPRDFDAEPDDMPETEDPLSEPAPAGMGDTGGIYQAAAQ